MSESDVSFDVTDREPVAARPEPAGAFGALVAALDAEVPVPFVTVKVTDRPGWAVKYRTNVAWAELQAWRKRALVGKRIDAALLSRLILANTCLGFVKDGDDAVDDQGRPITFGTIAQQRETTVADAVLVWLVTDGAVSGTSDLVYARSGYAMPDPEDDDEDPTQG